ncbi:MAG: hypothetical protein EHM18_06635 [Acidobacteria bacterium]|nr:MAG: hypothetical protein EHM18_06635 [Acidobacteriota bacterium]
MDFANRMSTGLFNLLVWPLAPLPPVWALTVISVFAGAVMVWIFGRVSRQERIRSVKDRIRGNLFGVRLYQHEIGVVFRLQKQIMADTARYMGLSVAPMLVILIPMSLIVVQLNLHFASRPLRPGEQAIVRISVADPTVLARPISLRGGGSFVVETPPVRIASANEAAWRIRAVQPGHHSLKVRIGDQEVEKALDIGNDWRAVSTLRTANWVDSFLYPSEPRLDPRVGINAVEVSYRPLPLEVLGLSVDWLVFFFIISVIAGFALKGVFGVQL